MPSFWATSSRERSAASRAPAMRWAISCLLIIMVFRSSGRMKGCEGEGGEKSEDKNIIADCEDFGVGGRKRVGCGKSFYNFPRKKNSCQDSLFYDRIDTSLLGV